MKDLTEYIESILDGVKNTCEVNYVNNIHEINVVINYFNCPMVYEHTMRNHIVRNINETLKLYLPKSLYVIRVKEINIPISFRPLEYTINSFGS
jgi:hypothetical protein